MSALNKFKSTASLFALGAMMLANTSCDKPGAEPGTPGGNGGGNEQNTIVQNVSVGANQKADYIDYDALKDEFKVKQTIAAGKATIVFKIVDKSDMTAPALDSIGTTSNGSVLDPNMIDVDAATKGSEYTFIKHRNNSTTLPLNISIPGNYIGEAPATVEGKKTFVKKVPDASFPGVIKTNILNGAKSARENAQDLVEKLQAVKRGEKKLQLVGQTANGYDGTFVYGSTNSPGTAFTIGKISAKP
ncbi:MAG TPA: hypothetical protein VGF14_04580 [Alphaproteobacteria bacterium]